MKNFKISFCTVTMNRLHHVKRTLIRNILDNEKYSELEFILVNYNSTDEIDRYVNKNLLEFMSSGILSYYKTLTPQYFHRSHSRNLAFKLSSGEIICNVDADNYLGKGFAMFVNKFFNHNEAAFLIVNEPSDAVGRICVKKTDFIKVGGYNEKMANYGCEDIDLIERLKRLGLQPTIIKTKKFLKAIPHSNNERIKNEQFFSNFYKLLVGELAPNLTKVIYLFKDGTFFFGTLQSHNIANLISDSPLTNGNFSFTLQEDNWLQGTWEADKEDYLLNFRSDNKTVKLIRYRKQVLLCSDYSSLSFFIVENTEYIEQALITFGYLSYKKITDGTILNNQRINKKGFGKDVVLKNFQFTQIT